MFLLVVSWLVLWVLFEMCEAVMIDSVFDRHKIIIKETFLTVVKITLPGPTWHRSSC